MNSKRPSVGRTVRRLRAATLVSSTMGVEVRRATAADPTQKQKAETRRLRRLTVAYSHMLHRDGALVGGDGAMLVEYPLTLGGAGYGFSRAPGGRPRQT